MLIREIKHTDAEPFAKLIRQVEQEAQYMLWEPGEREVNTSSQSKVIENILNKENATILVAEEKELTGYVMAIGGNANRNKHTVYIVIGVLNKFRGQGIGNLLINKLVEWANDHVIHRLELTVVTKNKHAISLYKKMGFEVEGTKKDSLRINGEFIDEYYMAKLL
ncbi:GNAT family N-acetyltransferase [Gracilibacillus caseinilyticus]|uniref:GNAT family N-acetyltransferase n=1 Tax=Gracilibacillus caseinilyticus TaxID=2932256 RepID=A0ABY4ETD0_9BACI|nr:GNAT family N-acetyltransferase [Gracilibacillus caseinilyticus]UOQ47680.1 GNAT family N-acetyltransferase [Gracilibacillus caseinilyticus]